MYRFAAVVSLTLSFCFCGYAETPPCSDSDARRAAAETDTIRDWGALYKSYRLYHACDDGGIAEGYSEATARILVDHWNTLPRLAYHAKRDPNFWRFVLKHVDETLDVSDVEKIRANTKEKCPTGLRVLCDELAKKADASP